MYNSASSYYKQGTIKVAWYEGGNYRVLKSEMFDNLDDALEFGKSKGDFMIMKLNDQSGDYYSWDVLPYGDWKEYNLGMKISNNPIVLFLLSILLVLGLIHLIKLIRNNG